MSAGIYLGSQTNAPENREILQLKYANRHGLIAGATGTGKTVTLQSLAEGFSKEGVPVFLADIKGDLSGIAQASTLPAFVTDRAKQIGFNEFAPEAFPVTFWDLFGEQGHPVRTTIAQMGPLLLARILELNETQTGVLSIVFRVSEEENLPLLDLKDLQSLLLSVGERSAELSMRFGNVGKQSVASIQRALLQLEQQGASSFFGEPALTITDFIRTDTSGRGMINILNAVKLMNTPKLYAAFLLWMLSELFDELPEIGDADKPKLVFFFDEAHLLFNDAPKSLLEKIEQVVRLIRSKGVGVYFVTQNPADIPESVLAQLGNRVQHALRAFTPQQQKSIKLAAQTYRPNPEFSVESVITELGVGEALVSTLGDKAMPTIVQRTLIRPPLSKVGVADNGVVAQMVTNSPMHAKYGQAIDRESAYELLQKRMANKQNSEQILKDKPARKSTRQTPMEAFISSTLRQVGRSIGNELVRALKNQMKRR